MKKRIAGLVMALIMVMCISPVSSALMLNLNLVYFNTDARVLKSFELDDFGIMTLEYAGGDTSGITLSEPAGNILTDYESYVMGAAALGLDTSKAETIIVSSQTAQGKFSDYVGGTGSDLVNSHIWGVISLYSCGNDSYDKAKALSWLLSVQNDDGGFPVYKGFTSDVDMTYMAMTAMKMLGKTADSPQVKKALEYCNSEKAVSKGCESIAWKIIARDFIGLEVDKQTMEELSKYRMPGGKYKHLLVSKEGNYMSTWHGILAKESLEREGDVFSHLRNKSLIMKGLLKAGNQ